jgi:hypothetical protein
MLFIFGAAVVLVVVASVVLVVAPLRRPERPLTEAWVDEADEESGASAGGEAGDESPAPGVRAQRVALIEREVQALRGGARSGGGSGSGGASGTCPACGGATAPSWRWCAACGAPLDAFAASLATRRSPAAPGAPPEGRGG